MDSVRRVILLKFTDILSLIQTVSIILAILTAIVKLKDRSEDKSAAITEMKIDIKYIKETVSKLEPLPTKVIQLEESVKSAHKRLDEHIAKHG